MDHVYKARDPKIRRRYELPLTGKNVVDVVMVNLCTLNRPAVEQPFRLVKGAPGVTANEVRAKTEARLAG